MNSRSTIHIMQKLSGGECSDPFEVRAMLSKGGLSPDSFAERFWRMLHLCTTCPVVEAIGAGYADGFTDKFPEELQPLVKAAAASSDELAAVDILRRVCVNKPLCRPCRCKDRIISFLADISGGDTKARNTAKRNVSNWLTDKHPIDRETYIRLCYALGLRTLDERSDAEKVRSANRFLSLCCAQNPLHLSNPEESIHYYCLRYPLGRELAAEEDYPGIENLRYAQSLIEQIDSAPSVSDDSWMFTAEVGRSIDRIRTEDEILAYALSCRDHQSDNYYTAKCVLRDFITACEDELAINGCTDRRMPTGISKETARRVVAAFEQLDSDLSSLKEISGYTRQLGDVLYASGVAEEIVADQRPMSRTVLLLCMLAQNCGAVFSPEEMDMVQTEDFTDVRSFNEFFRMLNATLEDCSMAAVNPRRRLDFLVLYTYFLFSRDAMMGDLSDAFSVYMEKALKRLTE